MSEIRFAVLLEPEALNDIQEAINFYDEAQPGLGKKFEEALNRLFKILEHSPFFAIRYDEVHCLPMRKFPYMLHYTLDEGAGEIIVRALFHTSIDPVRWKR
jgi:toxin ParE1/3/4